MYPDFKQSEGREANFSKDIANEENSLQTEFPLEYQSLTYQKSPKRVNWGVEYNQLKNKKMVYSKELQVFLACLRGEQKQLSDFEGGLSALIEKTNSDLTLLERFIIAKKQTLLDDFYKKTASENYKKDKVIGEFSVNLKRRTRLHWAALCNQPEAVLLQLIAEENNPVDQKDNFGFTPLHYAAKWGHLDAVKALLASRADVAATDNDGNTSLHWAARHGHAEIAKLLWETSPNSVNIQNQSKKAPLHLAVENGHDDVIDLLLSSNISEAPQVKQEQSSFGEPLVLAAEHGDVAMMAKLLRHGAAVNPTNRWRRYFTPLQKAAMNGHAAAVEYLIKQGAKLATGRERDYNDSVLCHAVESGSLAMVKAVIEAGAGVNEVLNNCNAIEYAVMSGHYDIFMHLLEHKATITVSVWQLLIENLLKPNKGDTDEIIVYLLDKKIYLNDKDKNDMTALDHLIAKMAYYADDIYKSQEQEDDAKKQAGSQLDQKNFDKQTILLNWLEQFLQQGCQLKNIDACYRLFQNGSRYSSNLLLEVVSKFIRYKQKLPITASYKYGKCTLLDLALTNFGDTELVKLLLEQGIQLHHQSSILFATKMNDDNLIKALFKCKNIAPGCLSWDQVKDEHHYKQYGKYAKTVLQLTVRLELRDYLQALKSQSPEPSVENAKPQQSSFWGKLSLGWTAITNRQRKAAAQALRSVLRGEEGSIEELKKHVQVFKQDTTLAKIYAHYDEIVKMFPTQQQNKSLFGFSFGK